MGLWKEHFHWAVLLRWDVLAWTIAIILAIGGLLLVFDQFSGANVCFMITALFVFAKITHIAITTSDSAWQRFLFTFILFGVIGVAIVETVRGVNNWRIKHEPKPPIGKPEPPSTGVPKPKDEPPEDSNSKPPTPPKEHARDKVHRPAIPHKTEPPASVPPIIQLPSMGNLKQRAVELSQEIMQRVLIQRGWRNWDGRDKSVPAMPADQKARENWTINTSHYFRFRFLKRVLDIRQEFADLHLRDTELDDYIHTIEMIDNARQMSDRPTGNTTVDNGLILPETIEEIAERLIVLANQIR